MSTHNSLKTTLSPLRRRGHPILIHSKMSMINCRRQVLVSEIRASRGSDSTDSSSFPNTTYSRDVLPFRNGPREVLCLHQIHNDIKLQRRVWIVNRKNYVLNVWTMLLKNIREGLGQRRDHRYDSTGYARCHHHERGGGPVTANSRTRLEDAVRRS